MKEKNSKAQIWIETVVYTLIALIMIGAVLAFAQPKIKEIQDKLILDRTFDALQEITSQIESAVNGGIDNRRTVNVEIKKGELKIDPANNEIIFTLKDSNSIYSEPEKTVNRIGIKIETKETGKTAIVTLTKKYDYNIETKSGNTEILTKSASAYRMIITNIGTDKIRIETIS
jgi:type II secretory pathway pseudopilin PulG